MIVYFAKQLCCVTSKMLSVKCFDKDAQCKVICCKRDQVVMLWRSVFIYMTSPIILEALEIILQHRVVIVFVMITILMFSSNCASYCQG